MSRLTNKHLQYLGEVIAKHFGQGVSHPEIEDIVVTNGSDLDITFADGAQLRLVSAYPEDAGDERPCGVV